MIAIFTGLLMMRIGICVINPRGLYRENVYINELKPVVIFLPFIVASYYYLGKRVDIAAALTLLIPVCLFGNWLFAFEVNYTIFYMGRDFELVDAELAAWDAALGFDWPAYFRSVVSRPIVNGVLAFAYQAIWWQSFALMIIFIVTKKLWDFACLQISLPLSFGLTCLVATFLPAIGAYHFHGMTPDGHPGVAVAFTDLAAAPLLWLRQTELPAVMPSFAELRLVSFPSWHAAAAMIFIMSAWPVPLLRWLSLVLNGLMLAATPVQGAHYLSEVIVGAGLGGIAFMISAWVLRYAAGDPEHRGQSGDLGHRIARSRWRARILLRSS